MREINELFTVRDMIRWAASRFNEAGLCYGHGTDSAWDEAVALTLHTLHLPNNNNPHLLDARLTSDEKDKLYSLIQRRIQERIPVPYLTKEAWFAGLSFYVDERVLIPRSPIAELIAQHFEPWIDSMEVHNVLDLCTGSGCIAIACADAFPFAHVDASDVSTDALAVANLNVLRNHVEEQVQLHQGDLFEGIPLKKYDIIVSNPPYVDAIDMAELPKEYHHEPKLGLEAGKEGLDIVMRILKGASNYLEPHGILVVEVGNSEAALIERFPEIAFTWPEFQHSVGGVFILTAQELEQYRDIINEYAS